MNWEGLLKNSKIRLCAESLQWSYNERDGVSNRRRIVYSTVYQMQIKENTKLRVTGQ